MKTSFFILKGLILSVIILFSSCSNKTIVSDSVRNLKYKDPIIESQRKIVDYMYTSFVPGASVSVSLNGETIWSEGFGKASIELNVPVGRKTKFRIGNSTEMFTTYIIALLQEQGKLNIDSSFYKYIPEYPQKQFDFTPRMLGSNTAGIDESSIDRIVKNEEIKSLKDYVSFYKDAPLVYQPDNFFIVAEYGKALLGILAEEVSAKHYSTLIKEMITDTLHLKSTVIDIPLQIIENRSNFYDLDIMSRLINSPTVNLLPFIPVHGMLSTSDDLNIAAQQILNPGFLNSESIELLTKNHVLNNGKIIERSFGWWVKTDENGHRFLAQIGNTIGGASFIVVCPEEGLVVTMASNKSDDVSQLPSFAIAEIFLKYLNQN